MHIDDRNEEHLDLSDDILYLVYVL